MRRKPLLIAPRNLLDQSRQARCRAEWEGGVTVSLNDDGVDGTGVDHDGLNVEVTLLKVMALMLREARTASLSAMLGSSTLEI